MQCVSPPNADPIGSNARPSDRVSNSANFRKRNARTSTLFQPRFVERFRVVRPSVGTDLVMRRQEDSQP
jgi:hypothetical protein